MYCPHCDQSSVSLLGYLNTFLLSFFFFSKAYAFEIVHKNPYKMCSESIAKGSEKTELLFLY